MLIKVKGRESGYCWNSQTVSICCLHRAICWNAPLGSSWAEEAPTAAAALHNPVLFKFQSGADLLCLRTAISFPLPASIYISEYERALQFLRYQPSHNNNRGLASASPVTRRLRSQEEQQCFEKESAFLKVLAACSASHHNWRQLTQEKPKSFTVGTLTFRADTIS